MKLFTALAASLALVSPVFADFLLVGEVVSTENGPEDPNGKAVDSRVIGDCDAMDNSPDLDGADGNGQYPWPEEEFRTAEPLCGIALRFNKNGNDYNVFDDVTGDQVGTCGQGSGEIKFCFWGLVNAEYEYEYYCTSQVCT